MPIVFIKAIPVDRKELKYVYECPVYKTKERGPTFVWTFNLKTKDKAAKWTLGGVGLLLQVWVHLDFPGIIEKLILYHRVADKNRILT